MKKEIWKIIEDFSDYYVSNLGRVKSFKIYKEGKILEQSKNRKGYFKVSLSINGKSKTKEIHRLVYEFFGKEKLTVNDVVHHKDENKENNYYKNLKKMNKIKHKSFHSKGKNNSQYGKKFSNERRNKISKSLKGKRMGKDNHMFGKHISEDQKKILRKKRLKFDIKQINQIYKLIKLGFKGKDIANIYNTCPSTISNIKNNRYFYLKETNI